MKKILTIAMLAFGMMAQAQDVKTRVIDNAGSGDNCGLSKREGWTFESKLRQGKDCCGEKASCEMKAQVVKITD